MRETTALGAAIAAGLAAGRWKSLDELKSFNKENSTIFRPKVSSQGSEDLMKRWEQAVHMAQGWIEPSSM